MKTYKGMSKEELIEKIVEARVGQCKQQNFKKFGNNDFARKNENANEWRRLYRGYPITSKTAPSFSLSSEYERFYGGANG